MVNTVEETPFQLAGRGLTYRPAGKFQPGEYEILDNVEISPEGTLKHRRGFSFCRQLVADTVSDFFDNQRRFIGHYGTYPIIATRNANALYMVYSDDTIQDTLYEQQALDVIGTMLPSIQAGGTALPGGYTITAYTVSIEGYWFYNGYSHFLLEYRDYADNGGGASTRLYRRRLALRRVEKSLKTKFANPHLILDDIPESVGVASTVLIESSISLAGGGTFAAETNPEYYVKNHLIHKDRAWIATKDTVYFSQDGDHSVWAAPDGGFIKFPNDNIKQIYALGDIIYVFCDSRIYAVTYNIDFNTDGEVNIISAEVGGESACSVGDVIYTYKHGAIYAISGNNVSKVLDTNLRIPYGVDDLIGNYVHSIKLAAFDNELYLFMYRTRGTFMSAAPVNWFYNVYSDLKSYANENNDTHLYKISLETGSTCRINLAPSLAKAQGQAVARLDPVDAYLVPFESNTNQPILYFLNAVTAGAATGFCVTYPGANIISNSTGGFNEPNRDIVIGSNFNTTYFFTPYLRIKYKDFSPDGSKFNMKKFRSLLVEANIPKLSDAVNMTLNVYFGDSAVPLALNWVENIAGGLRDSSPYRFPLNQRARYFTLDLIRLCQSAAGIPAEENLLEISDLRLLWSPTTRSVVSNTTANNS